MWILILLNTFSNTMICNQVLLCFFMKDILAFSDFWQTSGPWKFFFKSRLWVHLIINGIHLLTGRYLLKIRIFLFLVGNFVMCIFIVINLHLIINLNIITHIIVSLCDIFVLVSLSTSLTCIFMCHFC